MRHLEESSSSRQKVDGGGQGQGEGDVESAFMGTEFKFSFFKTFFGGFPGGAVVENLPANAGDTGSSPGLGRSHMPRSN